MGPMVGALCLIGLVAVVSCVGDEPADTESTDASAATTTLGDANDAAAEATSDAAPYPAIDQ